MLRWRLARGLRKKRYLAFFGGRHLGEGSAWASGLSDWPVGLGAVFRPLEGRR